VQGLPPRCAEGGTDRRKYTGVTAITGSLGNHVLSVEATNFRCARLGTRRNVETVHKVTATVPVSARRIRSRQRLLEVIRAENGVTRSALQQITGLSRSAVAAGVHDLLDSQLVTEQVLPARGKGAGRGRPSALLLPVASGGLGGGVDFGHAHVAVAIADTEGAVRAERRLPLDVDSRPTEALDTTAVVLAELIGECGFSLGDVRSVAVGVPAPIDLRTRRPRSVLAKWHDVDAAAELEERLGRRVIAQNDAELGAQGELRFGAGRGLRDFVYVKVSEGVGASLVLGGAVYQGSAGRAGEIGHIRLSERGGLLCRCGNRGCLETVLSTNVIEQRFRDIVTSSTDPVFPLRDLVADPVITKYVLEASRTLGRALADLCNWLNPKGVVIGGVLGTGGEPVVGGVREALERFTAPMLRAGLEIRLAELGLRSEVMGAVAAACRDALDPTAAPSG
jgi:predicted NBD/HSP70 family sugar kinase